MIHYPWMLSFAEKYFILRWSSTTSIDRAKSVLRALYQRSIEESGRKHEIELDDNCPDWLLLLRAPFSVKVVSTEAVPRHSASMLISPLSSTILSHHPR